MTLEYKAPIEDLRFLLQDVLKLSEKEHEFGNLDTSVDVIDAVLEASATFSERVAHPINHSGDGEGCRLADGEVITPKGFKEAYKSFTEGGWIGMTSPSKYGGQDLPHALNTATSEMVTAANPGFAMYTGMNKGAISALKTAGSAELQRIFLPKLVSGEWAATMNLTEAHSGTDLGLLRSKAIMQADGTYRITGSKIFISGGEHDFTDNIVHLVLARIDGAPVGSRGISLFVVPKFLVGTNGHLGIRNQVYCTGLEKKMGLKGSATCSMAFEEATGYLVGAENSGLQTMFAMMNTMRIAVGGQGVSLSDIAYQNATRYAKERLQGRTPSASLSGDQAEPIIRIPDVRRMLMSSKSFIESGRAFCLWLGMQLDITEKSPDQSERQKATQLLSLLTPVLKGYLTETAEEVISMALQCYGGHGYITETGIEQVYRDARISKIYEGATGVQAIDLLGRKVLKDGGRTLSLYLDLVTEQCELCAQHENLTSLGRSMESAIKELKDITHWLIAHAHEDDNLPGACSHHYLKLTGLIASGHMCLLMSLSAQNQLDNNIGNAKFMHNKLKTSQFYMAQYLPDVGSLTIKIKSSLNSVMALDENDF